MCQKRSIFILSTSLFWTNAIVIVQRIQVRIVRCDNTGVPGQLHYCRNGVVNNYALSFNLPIKTDITEIYFSWVNAPPLGLQKPDITVSLHSL